MFSISEVISIQFLFKRCKLSDKYGTRILCTISLTIMARGFFILILVIALLPLI